MILSSFKEISKLGQAVEKLNKLQGASVSIDELAKATNGLSAKNMALVLSTQKLTQEEFKNILATNGVKKELIEQTIATSNLTFAQTNGTISTFSWSTAFKGLGLSIKSATASIKAFLASNPAGWIAIAVGAITGLSKLRDLLTESPEEQIEKTKELEREYEELASKVNEVNSELKTTQNRIEELQGKDSLSFVEEEELERLRAENKELEIQKKLLEDKANLKKEEANQSLREEYSYGGAKHLNEIERSWLPETTDEDLKKIEELDKRIAELNHEYMYGDYDPSEGHDAKILENLEREANRLKKERDILAAQSGSGIVGNYVGNEQYVALMTQKYRDLYSKSLENPNFFLSDDKKEMDKIREALIDKATELNEDIERYGVEDEFSQGLKDLSLEISYALYPGEFKTELFEKEYNKLLPSAQKELEQIIGRNELTPETLVNFFPQESVDTLEEYGITVDDIIDLLHTYINVTNDAYGSTKDFINVLEGVQGLDTGMDMLGNIYKDVKDSGSFDYSSILNNEDFEKVFSKYGEEYSNFIKTIATTPDDIDNCQNAFNDLATAYIYGSGIMEDLNSETKNQTVAMLEQMGVTNALALVEEQVIINEEELALRKKFLAEYGHDLKYATEEETLAFLNEANATDAARFALFNYQVQEKIFNNSSLDVSGRMNELVKLATTYGVCGKLIEDYNNKQELAKKGIKIGTNYTEADIAHFVEQAKAELSAELASASISFSPKDDKNEKDTESAKEVLDKYFDYYEKQLQAGQITYKEYVQKCNDIRDKYYKDGKITSAEYYQYLADLYEKQLEYRDKAISAVVDSIDNKIKGLEKDKEKLEDYYNGLIEKIQSEIDELQKANEERERAIALQKAQYKLNRAINQRIDYRYKDGQFVYESNDKAVKDAQNELDDQLFDMRIRDLEKQIEDLEKALEDATETIDEQINALNEYRDNWSDISSAYEESQNRIYAASILGANWEADVLDGRLDKLENFKNEYLRIQGELAKANVLGADPGNASGGSGGSSGSGGSGNENDDKGKGEKPTPKHYNTRYKVVVGGAPVYDSGNQYTAKVWMKQNAPSGTIVSYKVPVYAKGGIVGNDKSPLDSIAHSLNEDHMVAVKTGERILTPIQNSNFEKLINVSADFVKLMKPFENIMKTPDFTKYVKNGNTKNDVVMNVTVNCPNVTNESGFNYITKELTSLTTKALQFDWNA